MSKSLDLLVLNLDKTFWQTTFGSQSVASQSAAMVTPLGALQLPLVVAAPARGSAVMLTVAYVRS
jgi:hypothetical protein